MSTDLMQATESLATLEQKLTLAVRSAFERGGDAGRGLKNFLHGVQLGHPLHPALTDIPIGAWSTALALDVTEGITRDEAYGRAADAAIAVGLVGAVGAATAGLTDWSEIDGRPKRLGLVHGLLNLTATTLYAGAYLLRRRGARPAGRVLAVAGFTAAAVAGKLGGDLVYRHRIGVTHADANGPADFVDVIRSDELPNGTMRKALTPDGTSVLLVRQQQRICALAHSCAHLGGPLSEGTLKERSVVCPWHGSEYALEDGHVINGPSSHPQPTFDVREVNGRIQVRARPERLG